MVDDNDGYNQVNSIEHNSLVGPIKVTYKPQCHVASTMTLRKEIIMSKEIINAIEALVNNGFGKELSKKLLSMATETTGTKDEMVKAILDSMVKEQEPITDNGSMDSGSDNVTVAADPTPAPAATVSGNPVKELTNPEAMVRMLCNVKYENGYTLFFEASRKEYKGKYIAAATKLQEAVSAICRKYGFNGDKNDQDTVIDILIKHGYFLVVNTKQKTRYNTVQLSPAMVDKYINPKA